MNKNKKYFLEKLGNHLYHWFLVLAILGLILVLSSQSFLDDLLQNLAHCKWRNDFRYYPNRYWWRNWVRWQHFI